MEKPLEFQRLIFSSDRKLRTGFAGYLQSTISSLQSNFRTRIVGIGIATFEVLFSALLGFFRPFHVNFFGTFCRLSQYCDFVRQDLRKSPRHSKAMRVSLVAVTDLAHTQLGNQRRVARQYPKVAVLARNLHLFRNVADDKFFRRHDFELESVHKGR
jgi:hypothetical protein